MYIMPVADLQQSITTGKTIAVVNDNDMESAESMIILMILGFNVWAVETGVYWDKLKLEEYRASNISGDYTLKQEYAGIN